MRQESDKRRPDGRIAQIAANQHGVLTSGQLLIARISTSGIRRRVSTGSLHRIHRGVYAVGHPSLSERGKWMAAVLASGDGAVFSHLSAAELWGIRRPNRRQAKTEGDRASSVLSSAQLNAAVREAQFLGLPLGDGFATDGTRTELEDRMLALCRRHRLPRPAVNAKVDRYEVDFLWRSEAIIVEVHGWEAHRSRSAFEADRARDARLAVLGYSVIRITWRRLSADGAAVAKTIRSLLRARAA